MAYLSHSNTSHHCNESITGRRISSSGKEERDPLGSEMYPQLRNSQEDQQRQQQEQVTRSTTPLSFYCTSPWNDQEFQELALQALTAATSSDQECGGDSTAPVTVAASNICTNSQSQNDGNATYTKRGVRFLDTERSGLNASDSGNKKLSVVDVQRDEKPHKNKSPAFCV